MKTRYLFKIMLLLHIFVYAQNPVPPSSGDGSEGDPYQIATWQNLYWVSQSSGEWSKHFIQTADIDFADADPAINTWASNTGWTPISSSVVNFSGSYDGSGHYIRNLYINRGAAGEQGMFGIVYGGCQIKNLVLDNVNIKGANNVGGLLGRIYHSNENTAVLISNCHVYGSVTATAQNGGGLVGKIEVMSTCSGGDYNVFIENCSANANVLSDGAGGALIGYCYGYSSTQNPRISYSYSKGSAGSTSSAGSFGGLIGSLKYSNVSNCYSTATVTGSIGDDAGGGFIGAEWRSSQIYNCYSTGSATGFGAGDQYGFIGYYNTSAPPGINNSFWDKETSGYTSGGISSVTGKTTAEMKTQSTFTGAGWDFSGIWDMDGENNSGYPYLSWQNFTVNAPQNFNIIFSSSDPELSWDQVYGAVSYKIYSSFDPYAAFPAGWTLETSVTSISWTDTNAGATTKKFYVVVALN
jgi:hypothetical protein